MQAYVQQFAQKNRSTPAALQTKLRYKKLSSAIPNNAIIQLIIYHQFSRTYYRKPNVR